MIDINDAFSQHLITTVDHNDLLHNDNDVHPQYLLRTDYNPTTDIDWDNVVIDCGVFN